MIVLKMMCNAVFPFLPDQQGTRRKTQRKLKHDTCHEPTMQPAIATENKDILSNKISPSDKYVFFKRHACRKAK